MESIQQKALHTLENNRVAVFIVAYNAESHLEDVLARIPAWVQQKLAEVYVIDDSSSDTTFAVAKKVQESWSGNCSFRVFRTPYNQGYGGNQRLGYTYAIEKGFDIVVLLHGDGQYAPEALPDILAPYADGASIVYGSRFLPPNNPRAGGMPLYKYLGNRVLTFIQNRILGLQMSEMHSGYRSYRVEFLQRLPLHYSSSGFDFDADIIVQAHDLGYQITEVPIPTYYGNEICHVNGIAYAFRCLKTFLKYRLMQFEIFYDPKFDLKSDIDKKYPVKYAPTSIHSYARSRPLEPGSSMLDVGSGSTATVAEHYAAQGIKVSCADQYKLPEDENISTYTVDLNQSWASQLPEKKYDYVFALDILEHLSPPENAANEIFRCLKSGGKLYASTGNIGFLVMRIMLLLGYFNYGRRGILDLTHTRLFTVSTFRRMLKTSGFRVDRMHFFGPPIADLADNTVLKLLDKLCYYLANLLPSVFAYQMLAECTRTDSLEDLAERAFPKQ